MERCLESLDRTVDTHIKTLRAKLRAVNPEKGANQCPSRYGLQPGARLMRISMRLLLGYSSYRRDRRVVCAVDLCPGK